MTAKKILSFLLAFLLFKLTLAQAAPIITLDRTADSIDMHATMLVYEDSTWNEPYEDLKEKEFVLYESIPSFQKSAAYWIRFSLRNPYPKDTLTLFFPFFTSFVTGVYWAEVHASSAKEQWITTGGRTSTIWNTSYDQHKQYAKLVIPPLAVIHYDIGIKYKHYHSDFKAHGLPTQIWTKRHLLKRQQEDFFEHQVSITLRLIFLCISALIFLINFIQFLLNRDKAYLFYALYVLFLFLFYALFSEENALFNNRIFFGRYLSPLHEYLNILFYSIIPITQLLFFRFFLDSPTYNNPLDRWLTIGLYITFALLIIDLACFALFGEQQTYQNLKDGRFLILLFCILYPIYLIYRSKDRLSNIVATGASFLLLFSLAGSFYKYSPSVIVNVLPELLTVSNNYPIIGALIEYTFFSVGLGYRMRIIEQRNQQLEGEVQLEQMRKQFYTNITHEFRTPLTLIITPLQQILNGSMKSDLKIQHERMLRNAQRLLQLINQLLNISVQETKKSDLVLENKEIRAFLRAIVFSFESVSIRKNIQLQTTFPAAQFVQIDSGKLETILSNLLSNAFKFTQEGGTVELKARIEEQKLYFSIRDNGMGIAETDLPYIFDRFYQANHSQQLEGSGIGLWTVKELVKAFDGEIEVESAIGKGTSFSVALPIITTSIPETEVLSAEQQTTAPPTIDNEKPQILIVEDNEDLRIYIKEALSNTYNVIEAKDGHEAWLLAKKVVPDLIITDLMMPQMDGLTLTEHLRDSHITDHIPIIILTAKAYQSDKIEGLRKGAEAYIAKPFDTLELQTRIAEMLKQRQRLRRAYAEKISLQLNQIEVISKDDQFLKSLLEYVEIELDNPDFDIEAMAKHVNMSRSQLYRKLKALTNESPLAFVRNLRLERAKGLLLQRSDSITSIAYQLGYSSVSYFTKSFKEKYGVSPSQFQKNDGINN